MVAGTIGAGSFKQFILARCLPNGTLDSGFRSGGVVITSPGGVSASASCVAVQDDGKILVAGQHEAPVNDIVVLRYEEGGGLDLGFGTNGIVRIVINDRTESVKDMAVQPDGRILLVGDSFGLGERESLVLRLGSDGELDPAFGTGGMVRRDLPSGHGGPASVALQGDGKILVGGSFSATAQSGFRVTRMESGGAHDPSFGTAGVSTVTLLDDAMIGGVLALQPDGGIVVGGSARPGGAAYQPALIRLEIDGSLDPGFGNGGIKRADGGGDHLFLSGLALQRKGGLLVVGTQFTGVGQESKLLRFSDEDSVPTPLDRYESVIASSGLSGPGAEPGAIPFNDGVMNLIKYAFNMNLGGPDSHLMVPGGNSGMPGGGLIQENGQTYWQVEYVVRRGSGLVYTPQKSTTLDAGSFEAMTATPTEELIDHEWKRLTIREPCDPSSIPTWFSRVQVALP